MVKTLLTKNMIKNNKQIQQIFRTQNQCTKTLLFLYVNKESSEKEI